MVPSVWGTTVRKECRWINKKSARVWLWKRHKSEKSKNRLSRLVWKSRKHRGIPTFPQPRLLLAYQPKPDISCATKTGHFNLLPTCKKQRCHRNMRSSSLSNLESSSLRACMEHDGIERGAVIVGKGAGP